MIRLKFKSILFQRAETQKICRILHNIILECFLLQSVLCNDISRAATMKELVKIYFGQFLGKDQT